MIKYILFFSCIGALAADTPLTLEGCYRIALSQNPLKKAACEGVVAAKEDVGVARSHYYPDIGIRASYNRLRFFSFFVPNSPAISSLGLTPIVGPENVWEMDINGHYLLYDFGKRRALLDQALAKEGIAREEQARIRQQILLNVAMAFHSLIASKALHLVSEETLKRTRAHLGIAKSRNDVGDAPAVDVYRAQVKVAEAEQELVRSRNLVRIASGNLNTAMGLPPEVPVEVAADPAEPIPPDLRNITDALERSTSCRPEVMAAWQRIQYSRGQVEEAKSAFGPQLHANGLYGRLQNTFFPKEKAWWFAVEFELPIFNGFGDVHNTRRARHEVCRDRAEYEQTLLDVRQDVWNAHSSLQEAYELIETTMAQVADAKESVRLAEERYKVGSSTINDLLDSQTSLARAEADHVSSRWQYSSAEAQYLWAQGVLCP